jgi:NADH-quinone oxidoreductase subunit A
MDQFLPILLMVVLASVFAIGSFVASKVLGPRSHLHPAKVGPYESGIAPRRELAPRFPVRFYLVAMIFIIFDIEVVFLYPFAVMFRQLSTFGLVEMASFVAVVFIAFAYLVSEGALDWGPGKRLGSRAGAPVTRGLNATVRRVGRPGTPPSARPPALVESTGTDSEAAVRGRGREPVRAGTRGPDGEEG